jgi:hypothetical protein
MRGMLLGLLLLTACGPTGPRAGLDAGSDLDAPVRDSGRPPDAPLDAPEAPPLRDCSYRSTRFEALPLELDVGPTSTERLRFVVPGLPEPAQIASATLRFTVFDADHPGEEGVIRLDGSPPLDLPAMLGWDNVEAEVTVDVTGRTRAGDNVVEFGPGPLPRSFFRVSRLALDVSARLDACTPEGPPPDPSAVRRQMHFHEAVFTHRATWVVPCPPGHPRWTALRDYAFTASGEEHALTDCEGLYRAGSGERGTATFTFRDVIPSTYGVYVRFRSSANRNPLGALFVVNGEAQRIAQRDPSGEFFEVLFGDRRLGGTVTVVLDSSLEAESDSVTWIRLEPR